MSPVRLALLGGLVVLAGCGGGEETGPLSSEERTFIESAESHMKTIAVTDPSVTETVISWKRDDPQAGLATELYDPLAKKLKARDRAIQIWDNVDECPSVRLNDLCDLWYDGLADQVEWDDQVFKFVDEPYSKASLEALTEAGRRETQSLQQSKAEIDEIKREAND